MADGHNSKHIVFDKESCHRRWSLLDLSSEVDADEQDDFAFPSTEKALSYFSNVKGERKSIDELRLGNDGPAANKVLPGDLPGMDAVSEEGDSFMHRGELWEQLDA